MAPLRTTPHLTGLHGSRFPLNGAPPNTEQRRGRQPSWCSRRSSRSYDGMAATVAATSSRSAPIKPSLILCASVEG